MQTSLSGHGRAPDVIALATVAMMLAGWGSLEAHADVSSESLDSAGLRFPQDAIVHAAAAGTGTAILVGGRQEAPDEPRPDEPDAGAAAEQTGPSDDPDGSEPESESGESALVPMDDRTAETLFAMGVMPYQERIPFEDFELATLAGGETALSDHLGKVVMLNFWATWCPPCREEMPSMQFLYDELRDEGFEILAVNVLESEEVAREFVEEMGFTYPILMDRSGRVMLRYGVRAYPTSYIVDREGYVIGVRPGFHDWSTNEVIASVRSLLESQ